MTKTYHPKPTTAKIKRPADADEPKHRSQTKSHNTKNQDGPGAAIVLEALGQEGQGKA